MDHIWTHQRVAAVLADIRDASAVTLVLPIAAGAVRIDVGSY